MSETLFTGDTHLYHANIILYSNRPYATLDEHYVITDGKKRWKNEAAKHECSVAMTEDLILKHNNKVKPNDIVYHVGDYCFGRDLDVFRCLRRMNGIFKFVFGNHDENLKNVMSIIHLYNDLKDRLEILPPETEITVQGQKIMLAHYAHRVWNKSHHSTWHLYGHSHGSLPDDPTSNSFDVGVDCHNYSPLTFAEVQAIMSKKQFKPVDHHGSK